MAYNPQEIAPIAKTEAALSALAANLLYAEDFVDKAGLIGQAAAVAEALGYTPSDTPYEFVGGWTYYKQYTPGQHSYGAREHVRGLTGAVVAARRSGLDVRAKANLIDQVVLTAYKNPPDSDDEFAALGDGVLSRHQARASALRELGGQIARVKYPGDPIYATELVDTREALQRLWHPIVGGVIVSISGLLV